MTLEAVVLRDGGCCAGEAFSITLAAGIAQRAGS